MIPYDGGKVGLVRSYVQVKVHQITALGKNRRGVHPNSSTINANAISDLDQQRRSSDIRQLSIFQSL